MDKRPKPRIWSGEDYESDPEEENKIRRRQTIDDAPNENVQMK